MLLDRAVPVAHELGVGGAEALRGGRHAGDPVAVLGHGDRGGGARLDPQVLAAERRADLDDLEAAALEQRAQRRLGEGGDVGVDHVPDHAVVELVLAVRDLEVDGSAALRVERAAQRADQLERVLDVLEHVAAGDQVGLEVADGRLRVVLTVDGDRAFAVRSDVARVVPDALVAARGAEAAQEVRLAAADLDDAAAAQAVALDQPGRQRIDVLDERRRVVERVLVRGVVLDERGVVGGVPDEPAAGAARQLEVAPERRPGAHGRPVQLAHVHRDARDLDERRPGGACADRAAHPAITPWLSRPARRRGSPRARRTRRRSGRRRRRASARGRCRG